MLLGLDAELPPAASDDLPVIPASEDNRLERQLGPERLLPALVVIRRVSKDSLTWDGSSSKPTAPTIHRKGPVTARAGGESGARPRHE